MQATENVKKDEWVVVVALALQRKSDQKYLLTRRGPGQSGAGEWEFPGGKIEPNETQKEALIREIKEELSITLNEDRLEFVGEHLENYPTKSVKIFLFKMLIDYNPQVTLTEHDLSLWLSKDQISNFNLSSGDKPFIYLL